MNIELPITKSPAAPQRGWLLFGISHAATWLLALSYSGSCPPLDTHNHPCTSSRLELDGPVDR